MTHSLYHGGLGKQPENKRFICLFGYLLCAFQFLSDSLCNMKFYIPSNTEEQKIEEIRICIFFN